MYRANISIITTKTNYTTYFAENVTVMVNGTKCYIKPISGTEVEGQQFVYAYLYFMPTAPIQTIDMLWIDDLEAPVGYQKPATADDITEFSSNFIVDDEVYVTRLTWFLDSNNNNVLDSGEDSTEFFNADGSFIAGIRYSVYVELEARDRDDDGKGDYVKFADKAVIKLTSQGNAQMTGNQNGAVYKFPAATMPKTAVTVDPNQLVIELDEGYTGRPIKTIKVNSVGTTELTSITAEAEDASILDVKANGMSINVLPADYGFAKGTYSSSVIVKDTSGAVLYRVPVTITVSSNDGPDKITPLSGSNVTVDSKKATATGIPAATKPADAMAKFEGPEYLKILGKNGKELATTALVGTGCKIQLVKKGEIKDEVTVVIKGEIDGNGKIDSYDAIYLLRNTLFSSLYPVVVEDDVDGNGKYDSGDAIYLLRYTLFPSLYPLK